MYCSCPTKWPLSTSVLKRIMNNHFKKSGKVLHGYHGTARDCIPSLRVTLTNDTIIRRILLVFYRES